MNSEVIKAFLASQQENIFRISNEFQVDNDSKLAEYNNKDFCWRAGRFIGEATFSHENKIFKITIKPRYGERLLLRMLEEIFNIRITKSITDSSYSQDWQHYIKRIIAFIWIQKLANANIHGMPKIHINRRHKGQMIKGRLDIKRSIKQLHQTNQIVSDYRDKIIDPKIGSIIHEAYLILKANYKSDQINIPDSAQDAINEIHKSINANHSINEAGYQSINYKAIYQSWKPVVDLSWKIIKLKNISLKQQDSKSGFGIFIDMAEVWEQYLRVILTRKLSTLGWTYVKKPVSTYTKQFFKRKLVPDLIFEKKGLYIIWDAKYKRMIGESKDLDREDFFQIHTYIQYYQSNLKNNVIAGGLLYPISIEPNFEDYRNPTLFNDSGPNVSFVIEGIEVNEFNKQENSPEQMESIFLNRFTEYLQTLENRHNNRTLH